MIKQGGRTPAPCFSCSQRPQLAPLPIPRPAGRQSDGNSHGASYQVLSAHRRGIAMERNQPYSPPCSQPPRTAQPSAVAGHPTADTLTRHFVNNNKKTACVSGRNSVKYAYETAEAYKAGREGVPVPHTPMQEAVLSPVPHSRNYLRLKSIITVFPAIINGEIRWTCA